MRGPLLATAAAVVALLPVLAVRGQNPGGPPAPKEQPHGDLALDCAECHTAERWTPLDETPAFRHDRTGFPLQAAHARAACKDCHRSLVFDRVGSACADCHEDVHRGELGFQCESCHTPTSWTNQQEMFRAHDRTRFPLFASHARLDCSACHRRQQAHEYKSTPAECGNCHISTYLATTSPSHVQAGFSRRCEDCHQITATSWTTAVFTHPATFPLQGAHAGVRCAGCHAGGTYTGLSTACYSCHQDDYAATSNPAHGPAGFPTQCESCHTITSWRPALFDHGKTRFPLTGAHTRTACDRCHPGGRYAGTPTTCFSCHEADYNATASPNHRAAGIPTQCQSCHNTGAWKPANFDHDKTRFPLTGAHARTDCTRCHAGGRYAGTPTDCYSCHQSDYAGTTNPNHQASGFPTQCQTCHNTAAWKPASIDHSKTRFPLTGAHVRVECTQCHTGGRYTGTPTDCYSCHQSDYAGTTNPNHQASGFPITCQSCHNTTAWRPANFDHGKTRFPLTGAHTRVDCAQCHPGGRYTGTPTDCYSCHQPDYNGTTNPNHQAAGFPIQCQSCHNTSAWRPATFNHDGLYFPIYSGRHRGKWSTCGDCHVNPGNYKVFECILCHEHSNRTEVDSKHREVSGYSYSSAACYRCHPRGVAEDSLGSPRRLP
jgi:hypothetical protein